MGAEPSSPLTGPLDEEFWKVHGDYRMPRMPLRKGPRSRAFGSRADPPPPEDPTNGLASSTVPTGVTLVRWARWARQ